MRTATTKTGLPRSAFAYAPTAQPSTWKLPYLTADGKPDPHVLTTSVAAVRESGVPARAMPAVKSRLRAAFRKVHEDGEVPDGIREAVFERPDGTPLLREATVLLDKGATTALVAFAPNGDALVIPSWDGAFYYAKQPWMQPEPMTPADEESLSSKWNAMDATGVLRDLIALKGNEADEPADSALIDKAIGAVTDFIRNETAEIVSEACDGCSHPIRCDCTTCSCSNGVHITVTSESALSALRYGAEHLRESGKRHSSKDEAAITSILDAVKALGINVAPPAPPVTEPAEDEPVVEPVIESSAPADKIRFRESSVDAAAVVSLAEADPIFDPATRSVWITPIKPGPGNGRDGFYYPAGTLREATQAGMFNGLKMFKNHPRKSDEKDLPERSVTDWFATTRESNWDEARQRPRVRVVVHEDADYRRFEEAPEQIAFSILGGGSARPGKVSGKDYRVVESFHNVNSVDWVTSAGAGGALDFAESATEQEFDIMPDIDKITAEQLREGNPALYASIVEAAKAETPKATDKPAAAPATEPVKEPVKEVAAADAPPSWAAGLIETVAALKQRDDERGQASILEASKKDAAKVIVTALAESTLPKTAKDHITAHFAEATIGVGGTAADADALKAAVATRIAETDAMVAALLGKKPSPVKGLGAVAATDGDSGSIREAVVHDLEGRWDTAGTGTPPRSKNVFGPGEDMSGVQTPIVGVGANVSESGQPAKLSEAGQAVQNELAASLK